MMLQPTHIEDPALASHARRVVSFYGHPHPGYHRLRRNVLPPAMHLGFWDERTRGHAEAQINMNRALAKRAGIRSGDRVLDAGCGAGHSSTWLVGELGVRVVGINLVPAQIYTARRTAYLLGLSHLISFERQDFTKTSFPEGSFEVVWALESVCHTQDKQGFLTEARRLLNPGGRLVVADMFRTQRPLAADEVHSLRSWLSGWAVPDLVVLRCPECEERVVLLGREDDWLSKGRQDFACGGCERQLTMAHRVEDIDGGLSANSLTRLPAS